MRQVYSYRNIGNNILAESKDSGDDEFATSFLRQLFHGQLGGGVLAAIKEQAFLDESCTHDSAPLTIVGGYLFKPLNAEEFQNSWHKTLKPFATRGITHFHAAACAYPNDEFVDLLEEERKFLFREMVALIGRTAKLGFVIELENSVYNAWRIDNPTVNSLVGSKYAACCFQSFMFIRHLLQKEDESMKIHYAFERIGQGKGKGHPFDRERDDLLRAIEASPRLTDAFRYGGKSHFPKGEMHALEAADLLVWTYSSLYGPLNPYTKIARRIFANGGIPHRATVVTPTALTYIATLNETHGIKENTYVGISVFKF